MTHSDTGERDELLRALADQRRMVLIAAQGIDDAQAAERTTVSELTVGGVLHHLTRAERVWTHVMTAGDGSTPDGMWDMDQYRMPQGGTLRDMVAAYEAAARDTDAAVAVLPGLGAVVPLPEAPWAPGRQEHWPVRRILLHLLRETAQHAGHADIVREGLDGASTTARLGA